MRHEQDPAIARRPRPIISADDEFWWAALRGHCLVIQRCRDCSELRHPPSPYCARCGSDSWDVTESSGRGEVYSFVVPHYPEVDGFRPPFVVALVELKEGTRLVANLVVQNAAEAAIGLPVEVIYLDVDSELTLPCFRPVAPG